MCVGRRIAAAFGLSGLLALVVACASPTLPLPPPAVPSITASSTPGYVHLASQGGAEPNAVVVIVNQNPTVAKDKRVSGALADAQGSWDAEVLASKGDVLSISETAGTDASPSITVQVP